MITQSQLDTIHELKAQGVTDRGLSKYGFSRSTVKALRDSGALPPRRSGRKSLGDIRPQDDDIGRKLMAYKRQGLSDAKIAPLLGVSPSQVGIYRKQRGIPVKVTHDTHISEWERVERRKTPPRPVTVPVALFCAECGETCCTTLPSAAAAAAERAWNRIHVGVDGCLRVK